MLGLVSTLFGFEVILNSENLSRPMSKHTIINLRYFFNKPTDCGETLFVSSGQGQSLVCNLREKFSLLDESLENQS